MNRHEKGVIGEEAINEYLSRIDCNVVDRNFRTSDGEIDIIFFDNDVLVFGEVKSRMKTNFGLPCEAVDYRKRKKITYVAKQYICIKNIYNTNVRFDVFEVYIEDKKIRHIKNAYSETI